MEELLPRGLILKTSERFGIDYSVAENMLISGIERKSLLILDNYGIHSGILNARCEGNIAGMTNKAIGKIVSEMYFDGLI